MKKTKHTKGKWKYNQHYPSQPVVNLRNGNTISQSFYGKDSLQERNANMHLIAAAPELLEACENLVRGQLQFPNFESYVKHAVRVAKQAITKATE